MKIKLHIVLTSVTNSTVPKYEVTVGYIITKETLKGIVDRDLTVKIGENFYKLSFLERDWNVITSTLNAHSRMRDTVCNAYLKQIKADGWKEIPQTTLQQVTSLRG